MSVRVRLCKQILFMSTKKQKQLYFVSLSFGNTMVNVTVSAFTSAGAIRAAHDKIITISVTKVD